MKKLQLLLVVVLGIFSLYGCFLDDNRQNPFDKEGADWNPPTVEFSTSDTLVYVKDTIQFRAKGSDNGSVKKWFWRVASPTAIPETTTTGVWKYVFAYNIETKVYVQVLDDDGVLSLAQDSVLVTVDWGRAVITMQTPDTSVYVKDTVRFRAKGSDVNGSISKWLWRVGDPTAAPETTSTGVWTHVFADSSVTKVYAQVVDDEGFLSFQDTSVVTVNWGRAVITMQTPDTAVYVKDTVQFRAKGSDVNGSISKWLWRVGDLAAAPETTSTGVWKHVFADSSVTKVYAQVIDDDGVLSMAGSSAVKVSWGRPILSTLPNTEVLTTSLPVSMDLKLTAQDINGRVVKYLVDVNGDDKWDDSSATGQMTVQLLGPTEIQWAARDDDGILARSGFSVWIPAMRDSRDNHEYKVVRIGSQIWMAENLAYLPKVNSKTDSSNTVAMYYVNGYDGINVAEAKANGNYNTYGALYNWTAALSVCPSGWHLPTDAEWKELETYAGGDVWTVGQKLRASILWSTTSGDIVITGTDDYGFSALPGGSHCGRQFYDIENYGFWWTATVYEATEYNSQSIYSRRMHYGDASISSVSVFIDMVDGSVLINEDKFSSCGFSVRCILN